MASSAQCRSSRTTIDGRAAPSSADATSWAPAPAATAVASAPPASPATARNGPSGRGVNRSSQSPQKVRAALWRSQNARTAAVFPTPASPATSTMRPRPGGRGGERAVERVQDPFPFEQAHPSVDLGDGHATIVLIFSDDRKRRAHDPADESTRPPLSVLP